MNSSDSLLKYSFLSSTAWNKQRDRIYLGSLPGNPVYPRYAIENPNINADWQLFIMAGFYSDQSQWMCEALPPVDIWILTLAFRLSTRPWNWAALPAIGF